MSPITTAAEAERALAEMRDLIECLRGVIEQETALVHAGKVRNAMALGASKSELAGQLLNYGEQLKANAALVLWVAPARCDELRAMQDEFRAVLQKNMIVLATSHAVSEGIVRRLSGDLARKRSPRVYGASGRTTAPDRMQGSPLAVIRTL